METQHGNSCSQDLEKLCKNVRSLISEKKYSQCTQDIRKAMYAYPHAPQPHNLMGILLEKQGEYSAAMKHFRAAWALDPAYLPCRVNLDRYGSFFSHASAAFDEDDCTPEISSVKQEMRNDGSGI